MFHKVASVATYARCGGIFNMHFTANLPRNLTDVDVEDVLAQAVSLYASFSAK